VNGGERKIATTSAARTGGGRNHIESWKEGGRLASKGDGWPTLRKTPKIKKKNPQLEGDHTSSVDGGYTCHKVFSSRGDTKKERG